MLTLLLKYWRLILPMVLLLGGLIALQLYVESEKRQAVEIVKQKINQATAEQVAIDEQIVYEAYRDSGVINDYVERMLDAESEAAPDRSEQLQSAGVSPRPTPRSEARTDLGARNQLSDLEVDEAVRKYADLLQ